MTRIRFGFLPKHSSWLKQVEVIFEIVIPFYAAGVCEKKTARHKVRAVPY